jgi:5-(carboxyamino)imidazole ribonucleotide synthase
MRIGIIGAGQLGQMLGLAARGLGHECFFLDPSTRPPAATAGAVVQAPFDDRVALAILAEKCDVLTYEFENVPVDALTDITDRVPIYPPVDALRLAQDRLAEKRLFESLSIPIPRYHVIDAVDDLHQAATSIGLPLVVKTRRMGYDGKGQFVLQSKQQIDSAWLGLGGRALIAEEWIDFDSEVSSLGVRSATGDITIYRLTRNEHSAGILQTSRAPVDDAALNEQAMKYMLKILQHFDYVGVLALELFVVGGQLLANEFAPRVHNSGHWTIEGAATSQFSNHILAITNKHPGATDNVGHAGMINLIGQIPAAVRQLGTGWLHDYGKTPRPGRKLGHITVVAGSAAERDRQMEQIGEYVTGSTGQSGTES